MAIVGHCRTRVRVGEPLKISIDSRWKWIPFYLKNHGRMACRAPAPKCSEYAISSLCPSASPEPPK